MKVALVEDNELLAENIFQYLKLKDIQVDFFYCVENAEEKVGIEEYEVLILDINLPGKSGLEYLQELRSRGDSTPVILLTSQNTSEDIVDGLEKGADDYISKPFNFEEFVARIKSLSRRKGVVSSNKVVLQSSNEEVEVDLEYKKVSKNKQNIYLPTLEYKLLEYFIQKRGKIISRDELYEEVWGEFDKYQLSRTVDVYIGYLRKKLGKDIIKTKKGDGYFIE